MYSSFSKPHNSPKLVLNCMKRFPRQELNMLLPNFWLVVQCTCRTSISQQRSHYSAQLYKIYRYKATLFVSTMAVVTLCLYTAIALKPPGQSKCGCSRLHSVHIPGECPASRKRKSTPVQCVYACVPGSRVGARVGATSGHSGGSRAEARAGTERERGAGEVRSTTPSLQTHREHLNHCIPCKRNI